MELLVVMAIFAIISGIVLWNYGRFESNLTVSNSAYEAALAVRQAQVFGVSVRNSGSSGVEDFQSPYGVYFDGDDKKIQLFVDKDLTHKVSTTNEVKDTFPVINGNRILKFCLIKDPSNYYCSDGVGEGSGDGQTLKSLSIIFQRPNPDAKLYGYDGGGLISADGKNFTSAEIQFASPRGDKKSRLTVSASGQISVDACNNSAKPCKGNPTP